MIEIGVEAASPRFGLLTTIDSPVLPLILAYLRLHAVNNVVAICDSKLLSKKDQDIFRDRVGERGLELNGQAPSIYQDSGPLVPFVFVDNHNAVHTRQVIEEMRIDCLVNAGTPRKLGGQLINSVRLGAINVHPGVLPKYRGSSAVEWSIYNDDQVGNTAHFMNEEYDAGPIIEIERYDFPGNAGYQDIRRHVYERGAELVAKVMKSVQSGEVTPATASAQDASEAKLWDPISETCMRQVLKKLEGEQYKYQGTI